MTWILIAALALVILVALVALIGAMLPKSHRASVRARFHQPAAAVWRAIADPTGYPRWRSDLETIERLPDQDGHAVWRETGKFGRMTAAVTEEILEKRRVTRIVDDQLPFGGSWTWELAPTVDGCELTVTEDGEIYNPIFRCLARFVFGYTSTMQKVLGDLGKHFQETATIEVVSKG